MAVNSYLIAERLEACSFKKLKSSSADRPIRYVTIYNSVIKCNENTAYIVVDPKMFPTDENEPKCLFLVLGELPEEVRESTPHDVICIRSSYSLGKLYEQVQEILEYYNAWEERLTEILMENGSLSELCTASVPYFGNPLTVQNEAYELIGVGETEEIAYPYNFREKDSDYLSDQWVKSAIDSTENIFERRDPFKFHYINQHWSLLMNLFDGDRYVAQICVDANHRPLVVGDYIRICILQKYVDQYLKCNPNRMRSENEHFSRQLREYLLGKKNREALMVSLHKRGWKAGDTYVCCAFRQASRKRGRENNIYISKQISEQFAQTVSFVGDSWIYAVHHLGKEESTPDLFKEQGTYIVERYGLMVGVSMTFDDFFRYSGYLKQARGIVEYHEQEQKEGIHFFEEEKLQYAIRYGIHGLPLESLMPVGLKALVAYDRENQSEYYETLRVYLLHNRNVAETLEALFIHRSTFKYRMQRIKEIMQTDLEAYEEQLYLEMILYELGRKEMYAERKICS